MPTLSALTAATTTIVAVAIPLAACSFDTSGIDWPEDAPGEGDPTDPRPPLDEAEPGDPPPPAPIARAFRLRAMELRDPHLFVATGFFGSECSDITDQGGSSVNARIAASVDEDADGDGYLDHSIVLAFDDYDPARSANALRLVHARCTAPVETTECTPMKDPVPTHARNLAAFACDVPPSTNTTGYEPPIGLVQGPCFATDPVDFDLRLETSMPHTNVVVAATHAEDGLSLSGQLRGFLAESVADTVELPAGNGATVTVSRLLPGGTGACPAHDDRDTGPNDESGWYNYFDFFAEPVAYTQ